MKLYGKYLAIHFKSAMEHKLSFFFTALGQFLFSFSSLLGVWFMFNRFHQIEGFTFPQVLLCFATVLMAFALGEAFFRGFDTFPTLISNGEFDRILVRPRSEVFQVLASRFEFSRMGRLLQALFVFAYALPNSGVLWTVDKVFTLFLMVFCGSLLFCFLFLLYGGIVFFTIEGIEFMNIFTDGAREFGRYPFSIYGKPVLLFLTFIVPLALFQYYPLLYLLGIETSLFYMLSPLLCLLFGFPAYGLWRFGLSRYKSTGS